MGFVGGCYTVLKHLRTNLKHYPNLVFINLVFSVERICGLVVDAIFDLLPMSFEEYKF